MLKNFRSKKNRNRKSRNKKSRNKKSRNRKSRNIKSNINIKKTICGNKNERGKRNFYKKGGIGNCRGKQQDIFGLVYINSGDEILLFADREKEETRPDLFKISTSSPNEEDIIEMFRTEINKSLSTYIEFEKIIAQMKNKPEKSSLVENLSKITMYNVTDVGLVYIFYLKTKIEINRGQNGTSTYNLNHDDANLMANGHNTGGMTGKKVEKTLAYVLKLGDNYTTILEHHEGLKNKLVKL